MKRVLFVPGRTHYLHDADYPSLLKAIDAKDYDSRFVPIKWEGTTLVDWTEQLSAEYDKCDPDNTVLAGFSMGAMAAFIIAANAPKKPQGLWLGSLSPYFAEDLPTANPQWRADQTPEHFSSPSRNYIQQVSRWDHL